MSKANSANKSICYERITDKKLTLAPQLEIVKEEGTDQVDYAIKALEELLCTTKGKLHQVVKHSGKTSTISTESLQQPQNGLEEEKDLRKNVKRVMKVIVRLLKDRLESVDEKPDKKNARIEEYHSKK
ncbi:hypothetical protein RhiirC2_768969 [Rhizophagus irregularis]|uniref:Uncharacterized protein n=1 Tax=Rhizophagus irregularis TaxID=588596 RepID=A0A2N1P092_9GLOM|nr:hypothetical protein RhiirC2_768969 [Rhizophagus irregularis]